MCVYVNKQHREWGEMGLVVFAAGHGCPCTVEGAWARDVHILEGYCVESAGNQRVLQCNEGTAQVLTQTGDILHECSSACAFLSQKTIYVGIGRGNFELELAWSELRTLFAAAVLPAWSTARPSMSVLCFLCSRQFLAPWAVRSTIRKQENGKVSGQV